MALKELMTYGGGKEQLMETRPDTRLTQSLGHLGSCGDLKKLKNRFLVARVSIDQPTDRRTDGRSKVFSRVVRDQKKIVFVI